MPNINTSPGKQELLGRPMKLSSCEFTAICCTERNECSWKDPEWINGFLVKTRVMSSCFTTQEDWNFNVHIKNEKKKGKKNKFSWIPMMFILWNENLSHAWKWWFMVLKPMLMSRMCGAVFWLVFCVVPGCRRCHERTAAVSCRQGGWREERIPAAVRKTDTRAEEYTNPVAMQLIDVTLVMKWHFCDFKMAVILASA